jgi:hypothetical protein
MDGHPGHRHGFRLCRPGLFRRPSPFRLRHPSLGDGHPGHVETAGFSAADVNEAVAGPGIPDGTVIASVTDPATAELPAPAGTDGTDVPVTVSPRSFADGKVTAGDPTLTSASAGFTTADTGRIVTGDGIAPNTVISTVTDPGTVQLSRPATAGGGSTVTVAAPVATPRGPYTMTVVSDGGPDVQPGGTNEDPSFTQSVISSGATFTVSDY